MVCPYSLLREFIYFYIILRRLRIDSSSIAYTYPKLRLNPMRAMLVIILLPLKPLRNLNLGIKGSNALRKINDSDLCELRSIIILP